MKLPDRKDLPQVLSDFNTLGQRSPDLVQKGLELINYGQRWNLTSPEISWPLALASGAFLLTVVIPDIKSSQRKSLL